MKRILECTKMALANVFRSKFSIASNVLAIFIGLGLFTSMISLSVGVGRFLEAYYTRTMSLTTLVAYYSPEVAGAVPFTKGYREKPVHSKGVSRIIYHDILFANLEFSQGRRALVSIRTAAADDPELERLEFICGRKITRVTSREKPEIVIPHSVAITLTDLPPEKLLGEDIALTFDRSVRAEDNPEEESVYCKVVGIVNESPNNSIYVPYPVVAAAKVWQRTSKPKPADGGKPPSSKTEPAPARLGPEATSEVSAPTTPTPVQGHEKAPGAAEGPQDVPSTKENEATATGKTDSQADTAKPQGGKDRSTSEPRASSEAASEAAGSESRRGDVSAAEGPTKNVFKYATVAAASADLESALSADDLEYPHLRIHVRSVEDLIALRSQFQKLGVPTTSVLDDVAAIRELRNYAILVGGVLGCITLVAAMCSIFNTLLASVERRTQEIGILRSLGASTLEVLSTFLLEAVFISLLGSVLTIGIVFFSTKTANERILSKLSEDRGFQKIAKLSPEFFAFPIWLPLATTAVGLAASVVAGIAPAVKACTIPPTEALRHD